MNSYIKRLIALILTLCLVLEPAIYAHADGNEVPAVQEQEEQIIQTKQVNPVYEGIVSEEDLNEVPADTPATFAVPRYTDDLEAIGEILRQAMVKREETATVYYYLENGIQSEESINEIVKSMVEEALKETEIPKEGDYLRWNLEGTASHWEIFEAENEDACNANVTVTFTYYTTAEQEKAVDNKLKTILWETLNLDDTSLTNYQKTKKIYDYICGHVKYDEEHLDNPEYNLQFTAYAALIDGTSVCQGYATLMYRMLEEAGIDARVVVGHANNDNHAWNISRLGNKYYYSDSTWDAGVTKYKYFLKGYENFERDHTPFYDTPVYEDKYANTVSATDFVLGESDDSSYTEDVEKPEQHKHSLVKVAAKAATCTKTGNIVYYKCSECESLFKDSKGTEKLRSADVYVAAKGHKYGSYKTVKKATFGKTGTKEAACSRCSVKKKKTIPAAKTPVISPASYTFNNKSRYLSAKVIEVNDTKGVPLSYSVTYTVGKKVGKYAVKVKLTDSDYTGTKTVYYKINPKGVSISKVSKAKKAFTVKWKKPSSTYRKQMTGYQIRYSTSSKMKNAKTVTVKKTTATSKKISKLKAKKTYYVQLRTYKKVGSKTYYSGWSKSKKVKTK